MVKFNPESKRQRERLLRDFDKFANNKKKDFDESTLEIVPLTRSTYTGKKFAQWKWEVDQDGNPKINPATNKKIKLKTTLAKAIQGVFKKDMAEYNRPTTTRKRKRELTHVFVILIPKQSSPYIPSGVSPAQALNQIKIPVGFPEAQILRVGRWLTTHPDEQKVARITFVEPNDLWKIYPEKFDVFMIDTDLIPVVTRLNVMFPYKNQIVMLVKTRKRPKPQAHVYRGNKWVNVSKMIADKNWRAFNKVFKSQLGTSKGAGRTSIRKKIASRILWSETFSKISGKAIGYPTQQSFKEELVPRALQIFNSAVSITAGQPYPNTEDNRKKRRVGRVPPIWNVTDIEEARLAKVIIERLAEYSLNIRARQYSMEWKAGSVKSTARKLTDKYINQFKNKLEKLQAKTTKNRMDTLRILKLEERLDNLEKLKEKGIAEIFTPRTNLFRVLMIDLLSITSKPLKISLRKYNLITPELKRIEMRQDTYWKVALLNTILSEPLRRRRTKRI